MMYRFFTIVVSFFAVSMVSAQDLPFSQQEYDLRKEDYMANSLTNFSNEAIVIQAYKGLPVDQASLDYIINRIYNSGEFDFNLVQLVRVMYFNDGKYESQLLPAIQTIPLWLTPNEKLRVYWSENHICMWLSSAYLLKQKYGITNAPADLDKMLNHFLDLKIKYGYYEFFSSVYFPYTLSGLLNLVDFAADPVIKQKAALAAERLLKEVLMVTNDLGVFYPSAGRNYSGKYETPYGQNHNNLIYLLTGFGEEPNSASHAGAFLATTSLDVKGIVESWKKSENTVLNIGHTLQEGFALNSQLSKEDKTIFQWSSGAYFHPDVALESATLINDYNLWDHKEFKEFTAFKGLPPAIAALGAEVAASISKSSVICGQDVAIFKNKSVVLTSVQDFWKGRKGYQQFPWAANTGTLPVYTFSGEGVSSSGDSKLDGNSTLPYIQQKDNIALIMYRANKDLAIFGFDKHDITLVFKEDQYDEVAFEDQWILGREGDSYVAILRHCYDKVDDFYTCNDQDGQVWGAIVGNADMYGSFANFRNLVANAKHEEKWIFKANTLEWIYYGMIEFDGKKLEHYWNGNLLTFPQNPATGVEYLTSNDNGFQLYPNPAKNMLNLQFIQPVTGKVVIRVHDMTGREVHVQSLDGLNASVVQMDTRQWGSGMFTVLVETSEGVMSRKLVVQNQ